MWNKIRKIKQQYLLNKDGNFAIPAAVSLMTVIMGVGSAIDVTALHNSKKVAQNMADSMALMASIAVETNNYDKMEEGVVYTYSELYGSSGPSGATLEGTVEYDIIDDLDPENMGKPVDEQRRLVARSTVTATYKTSFMAVIPKYKSIDVTVTSDVAYALDLGQPASVFFAVDNSGSMGWNDASGNQKLTSLESSLKNFMSLIDTVGSSATNDFVRVALYPYSQDYNGNKSTVTDDGIISAKVVNPTWGVLEDYEITRMSHGGGTDSSGALEKAAADFVGEPAEHLTKNPEFEPLQYMIFMSDGSNNESYECSMEMVTVPGTDPYYILYTRKWSSRKNKWRYKTYNRSSYSNYPSSGWQTYDHDYVEGTEPYEEEREQCSWDYHADTQSVASCQTMKDNGVTVYSIGYYLVAGQNGVTQTEVDRARQLLRDCATDDDHYILANNAAQLDSAFQAIGEHIIEETVRVKR